MKRSFIFRILLFWGPLLFGLSCRFGPSSAAAGTPSGEDRGFVRSILGRITGVRNHRSNPGGLNSTRELMDSLFRSYGWQILRQPFSYDGYTGGNVIAVHRGRFGKNGTVIVMAHFDTVEDSPGADDNGSGLAVLASLAHVLAGRSFRDNIVLLALDGEEYGMAGSKAFVRQKSLLPPGPVIGVFNLDMVGYYSQEKGSQTFPAELENIYPSAHDWVAKRAFTGDFLISVANTRSTGLDSLFRTAAAPYAEEMPVLSLAVAGNGETLPDLRRSDHSVFWDSGYRALYLGDGAFTRNPNYHGPGDVAGTVSCQGICLVSNMLSDAIGRLANVDQ